MNVYLKEPFLLLPGTERESDVLYNIETSDYYRIYENLIKKKFHNFFINGSADPEVASELKELAKGDTSCSLQRCGSCTAKSNLEPQEFTINKLALVLTSKCNLRCKYCYANYGMYDYCEETTMDKSTLLNAFKYLLSSYKGINNIQFFGGEPSLCIDLIKETIQFFNKAVEEKLIEKAPRYGIVTNGVYMPDELVAMIKENEFIITISLDGPELINDSLRIDTRGVGKFKRIKNNYQRLVDAGVKQIGIECTYTAEHIKRDISLVDLVKYFDQNFGCAIPHIVPVNIEDEHELSILPQWDKFKKYIDEVITYAFDTILEERRYTATTIVLGMISRIITHSGQQRICPAGVQTFSLSHDNKLSPCFMYTSDSDIAYGSVGDDPKKILEKAYAFDEAINNKEVSPNCATCVAKALCSSCLGSFDIKGNTAVVSNKILCETVKYTMLSTLKQIVALKKDSNKWECLSNFFRGVGYEKTKE